MSRSRTSPREAGTARNGGAGTERVEAAIERVFAPHLLTPRGLRFAGAWRKTLRQLRPLGAVSLGNRVRVLFDGDEVFEGMWAAIAEARSEVLLATYILEPDRVGLRTLAELRRAAERGCRVLLVVDAFGSHRLGSAHLEDLRALGATVIDFNPIVRWRRPLSRLVRYHKKILVCDRQRAYCGGMNVAEEYAGPRHGNGLFRDTQLFVDGPAARDLAHLVEGEAHDVRGPGAPRAEARAGALVQILESNVRRHRRAIQKALRVTLARAQRGCFLTSPYFVPPGRLLRALEHAARRGVDVRVLTAGRSDVPLVRLAAPHLYGRLLAAGLRIFELESRMLHAKTVTVDGVYASVGSFNLDYWSDRRNVEVTVGVLDPRVASALDEQFLADVGGAREIRLESWNRRSWLQRFLGWLAYQILRI